jgi:Family of unknown function (DUF5755)
MKKCPPGVFCIQNLTISFLIIITLLVGFLVYSNLKQKIPTNNEKININIRENQQPAGPSGFLGWLPSYPYNNFYNSFLPFPGKNVLEDAYAAPLRDERYFVSTPVMPINVSTNIGATPPDTNYRQIGIMTPLNGDAKDNILPLMGRPLFTNRDKWQYYTISNQHNNIKLPISFQGKSGLNDYGVNQINSGDTVYVEGYNEPFGITVYENDTIKYLPFV